MRLKVLSNETDLVNWKGDGAIIFFIAKYYPACILRESFWELLTISYAIARSRQKHSLHSAAAEAAMTAVTVAGVQRPEAEEETGAADTGAVAEAALGELCFLFFSYENINWTIEIPSEYNGLMCLLW